MSTQRIAVILVATGAVIYLIDAMSGGKVYSAADSPLNAVQKAVPMGMNLGASVMAVGGLLIAYNTWVK